MPSQRQCSGKGLLGRHRSHHSIPPRIRIWRPYVSTHRSRLPFEAVPAFFTAGEDTALLFEVGERDGGENGELMVFTAVVNFLVNLDCSLCCMLALRSHDAAGHERKSHWAGCKAVQEALRG